MEQAPPPKTCSSSIFMPPRKNGCPNNTNNTHRLKSIGSKDVHLNWLTTFGVKIFLESKFWKVVLQKPDTGLLSPSKATLLVKSPLSFQIEKSNSSRLQTEVYPNPKHRQLDSELSNYITPC